MITEQQNQDEGSEENEKQEQEQEKPTNKQKTKQQEATYIHQNVDFTKQFNSFYCLAFNKNWHTIQNPIYLDNTCCVCGIRSYNQRLYTCKNCGQALCNSICASRHAEKCKKYIGQ